MTTRQLATCLVLVGLSTSGCVHRMRFSGLAAQAAAPFRQGARLMGVTMASARPLASDAAPALRVSAPDHLASAASPQAGAPPARAAVAHDTTPTPTYQTTRVVVPSHDHDYALRSVNAAGHDRCEAFAHPGADNDHECTSHCTELLRSGAARSCSCLSGMVCD